MELTQEEVDRLREKWQSILKLLDWDIRVAPKKGFDVEAEGRAFVTLERRMAAISIRTPEDFPCGPTWTTDVEHTLVHEMLHCHFAPFAPNKPGSMKYIAWEQAIDTMATICVSLDRSRNKP